MGEPVSIADDLPARLERFADDKHAHYPEEAADVRAAAARIRELEAWTYVKVEVNRLLDAEDDADALQAEVARLTALGTDLADAGQDPSRFAHARIAWMNRDQPARNSASDTPS
jgi:heme oxygenase